jgi:rhodanese-related sulfurtransferase
MRISTNELASRLEGPADVQIVDVRSVSEFSAGHIPAAVNIPIEEVESRLPDLAKDKVVVLVCHSGTRAQIACDLLIQHHSALRVLEGGTQSWTDAGHPVVTSSRTRWGIERQVRLAAGIIIVSGVLLSLFVNPAWVYLSGFVGLGLTFAGLTDICGMGILFARMPWNKPRDSMATACANSEVRL